MQSHALLATGVQLVLLRTISADTVCKGCLCRTRASYKGRVFVRSKISNGVPSTCYCGFSRFRGKRTQKECPSFVDRGAADWQQRSSFINCTGRAGLVER